MKSVLMMNSSYKYKFSIIIPIYNTEKYLADAIENVISQSIGFENCTQIILVDDGSTDNSGKIASGYAEKYPDNIIYIYQENNGVSSARNRGIEFIEGKYVNFLDSDDKWCTDAFEIIYRFFETHYEDVDIVAGRMGLFDAWEGFHRLDYKFSSTRIIDIFNDFDCPQMHITSCFIKSDSVKNHYFDTGLLYGEDAVYASEIILKKKKYAAVREAVYMYRRRSDETSLVQNKVNLPGYYKESLDMYYEHLFGISQDRFGTIIPYIQYQVMYDVQWRIKTPVLKSIDESDREDYRKKIISILKRIDDYIIAGQKNINEGQIIYALSLKYEKDVRDKLYYKKGSLYFNNLTVYRLNKNTSILRISILELNNGILKLEGIVNTPLDRKDYEIFTQIDYSSPGDASGSARIKFKLKEAKKSIYKSDTMGMDAKTNNHYTFVIEIPLDISKSICFIFQYKREYETVLDVSFGLFGKLSRRNSSYYVNGSYILVYNRPSKSIRIFGNTFIVRVKKELRYWRALYRAKKTGYIPLRLLYFISKALIPSSRKIWLISDREDKADDNGEHFFRFLCGIKNNGEKTAKNIKPVYVLSKECDDFNKLKKAGCVIPANSLRHKLYFLLASRIISSQANNYVINVFGKANAFFKDLYNYKFIFLQHGITKDDGSRWMKKFSKNIKMLVAAARPEYDAFVKGDYYYTEKEVKLTGFPRYDALADPAGLTAEKKILINPTWRKSIKGSYNEKSESVYLDTFKNTEYFKFYNNLINDDRVLKVLKEKGYRIKFCMHPIHSRQWVDYDGNDYVDINHGFIDYQYEFRTSALMVTDYSSVAFDMAYLRKPVIYSQFDADEFFSGGHSYDKGYYDYETDGFGPVCHNYEETVTELIKAIENDCVTEQKYLSRIDSFYAFNDRNNCMRVYEEILKL